MVLCKKWTLAKPFIGKVTPDNFKLVKEDIPEKLNDGELLCEAVYLTVDPYMRVGAETGNAVGNTLFGEQIAKVIVSKNAKYPVGSIVRMRAGWRTHTLVKDAEKEISRSAEMGDLPLSLMLGAMGMPGMTAYFGFLELCQPKAGETVVVSGAAGAVGSLVGQIAKIKGCKVIGFAGTEEKCKWIKEELGFDFAYNYKKTDVDTALKEAAPDNSVDCYFDNVGGMFTVKVLTHMKTFGRVSICGSISNYNDTSVPTGPLPFFSILKSQLRVEGFIVLRWYSRWEEGETAMRQWIKEGKIKYKEHVTEGFEKMPDAFMGLFEGRNTGKAIIKM
ncbi:prostaglandin reductase 1-like [Crassostrea angulata]|uniref:Prostaglandin reductase 1 n=4 Tax=Magallana TaxID=2171616 RepID=A0A8W8LL54_MAGGI|nr:prostaglandin reductase 1-like [Crassostrea gigas]XP_052676277.1 prostaglandin reductase 1-like [Crassostrea angulata]